MRRRSKRTHDCDDTEVKPPQKPRRSLGYLYNNKNKKTQARSPDLTGQMRVEQHTLEAIILHRAVEMAMVSFANIAGWLNRDKQDRQYITVEISPNFRPRANERYLDDFLSGDGD